MHACTHDNLLKIQENKKKRGVLFEIQSKVVYIDFLLVCSDILMSSSDQVFMHAGKSARTLIHHSLMHKMLRWLGW